MTLTKVSYSMINGAPANVLDFGAVGDGVTDDTAAINLAIVYLTATGGEVVFPTGTYLISSTLSIAVNGITLRGTNGLAIWNGVTSVYQGGSVILKKSTMTTEAIKCADALKLQLIDIAVLGQTGNTGDGIYIPSGQNALLQNVSVAKVGGAGIRIGAKAAESSANANGWQMNNVTSMYNGGHGVYLYDEVHPAAPNANGGTSSGLIVRGNTGDGLHIENAMYNTFSGLWSELNTGYGVSLIGMAALGIYTNFIVSDVEANTAGQWNFGANLKHISYVGPATNAPTIDPNTQFSSKITGGGSFFRSIQFNTSDSSLSTYKEAAWAVTDGSVDGLTFTLVNCSYVKIGKLVTCTGRITWPVTAGTAATKITLPFTANGTCSFSVSSNSASALFGYIAGNFAYLNTAGQTPFTNASMSGKELDVTIAYISTT